MATAYIDAGSNIDPEANIPAAVRALGRAGTVTGISTFYRTAALARPADPDYYNGTVRLTWDGSPHGLKDACGRIENDLQRVRTADRYAPRTIDLDILLYDDLVMDDPDLTIPDPHITGRPFLALALYELDPGLIIPGTGTPLAAVAADMDRSDLAALEEFTGKLRKEAAV